MKNSDYIKDLLDRVKNTDSIKEKKELEFAICNWCHNLLKSICKYEASIKDLDASISFSQKYYDCSTPKDSKEYRCYEDEDDRGNDGIQIYHDYVFRGEQQMDCVFVPYYLIDDIEGGIKKYHQKKLEESQELERRTIIFDLKQLKKKIEGLSKDVPEDFKKIIDNNFWDLI